MMGSIQGSRAASQPWAPLTPSPGAPGHPLVLPRPPVSSAECRSETALQQQVPAAPAPRRAGRPAGGSAPRAGGAHRAMAGPRAPSRAGRSRRRRDAVKCYDTSLMTHLPIKERQPERCFTTHLALLAPLSEVSCHSASHCCQVLVRAAHSGGQQELGRAWKMAFRSIIDRLEMARYAGPERNDVSVKQNEWLAV